MVAVKVEEADLGRKVARPEVSRRLELVFLTIGEIGTGDEVQERVSRTPRNATATASFFQ